MIIKSKRVRARGQAVNRLITHLTNGDDNDSVELLRGNEAQLHDWRNDALRFGREYSIRHWCIAPSRELSSDQLDEVVSRLGAEFDFNPKQAVIWMHRKDRATADGCSQHFHVLVAEVDPLSGKVMSTSHDYARHEKIAILVCNTWGIPFVAGPHAETAARTLEADGLLKAEDILQSQKLDHGRSFSERDHQIAKRRGFDLPRLRVLLSDTLENAGSRAEFEKKLAEIGLRLDEGRKGGILVISAADGTFVGSLSRLTRFRKSELAERMKFNDRGPREETERPIDGRTDSRAYQEADPVADDALRRHGGRGTADRSGYAHPASGAVGGEHRAAAGNDRRNVHPLASPDLPVMTGPADHFKLAIESRKQHARLLDLLVIARRSAMTPVERIASDLTDQIEANMRAMRSEADLPEPVSLHQARNQLDLATRQLRALERQHKEIEFRLENLPPPKIWNRLTGTSHEADRRDLQIRADILMAKITQADDARGKALLSLTTEQQRYRAENRKHLSSLAANAKQAADNVVTLRVAKTLLSRYPRIAYCGTAHLIGLAAAVRSHDEDKPDDLDLWGKTDIWGIALQPRTKPLFP